MLKTFPALALSLAIATAPLDVKVDIDFGKVLAVVPKDGLGIGVAVWDKYMVKPDLSQKLREAGVSVIRYPGGSYADLYHWKTHSSTKGYEATIRPGTAFDDYMQLAKRAKTQTLITVNYGSNESGTDGASPSEAAAWVKYSNKTRKYGVKYWEIGNEVYGNGFYNGKGWELDLHAPITGNSKDVLKNPKLGPVAYGQNVLKFVEAMKKEDPTIKIGAVLCTPGNWPDAVDPDWNTNVLRVCGKKVDFVVVHWYGEGRSAKAVLDAHKSIPAKLAKLRSLVKAYCSPSTGIWMTEGDASGYNTRHPGALFAANQFLTWWENGASHINWWDLHNGAVKAFDGELDDQGVFSNASTVGQLKEPALNTPFPPYYGVCMTSLMVRPGDTLVQAHSDIDELVVHAAKRKDGSIAVMLINQNPTHNANVSLHLSLTKAVRSDFGPNDKAIRKTALGKLAGQSVVNVPPYTITLITGKPSRKVNK